jgi:ADP-ribose pyrophosphatase
MTGANMNLVTIEIELPADAPPPQPKPDEGEHIVQRIVPLKDLNAELEGMSWICLG